MNLNTLHLHAVTCISHMTTNAGHRVICVIACPRLKERFVEGVWKKCVKCPSTGLIEVKLFFIALFMYFFWDQYFCS